MKASVCHSLNLEPKASLTMVAAAIPNSQPWLLVFFRLKSLDWTEGAAPTPTPLGKMGLEVPVVSETQTSPLVFSGPVPVVA